MAEENKDQPVTTGEDKPEEKTELTFEESVGQSINQLNEEIKGLKDHNKTLEETIIKLKEDNNSLNDTVRKMRFENLASGGTVDLPKDDTPKVLTDSEILERFKGGIK